MCTLIDKAQKLSYCDNRGANRKEVLKRVRFDIECATDASYGTITAINSETRAIIC